MLRSVALIILLTAIVVSAAVAADWWLSYPEQVPRTYVGRASCAACHQAEVDRFEGSDHDRAFDKATPETVLGDFDDAVLTHFGVASRMFRRGDEFFIETEGVGGQTASYPIGYVIGVRPLQQYLVEFDDGRLQVLPIAWNVIEGRWFHLYPTEHIEHTDVLHWTRWAQTFNHMCGECHTTDYHKNYDVQTDTYDTTYAEIDVSCEACHGPGSLHIDLARASSLFWDRRHGYGLARLKEGDSKTQIETCARCHAHRAIIQPGFQPGDEFCDHYNTALMDGDVYHVDGQIRPEVEAYVYGSFLESKMYRKGVRCTDCHDPHTAGLRAEGNALCARCHTPARYDAPSHHFHPPDSPGARCVECHMPETTYMVIDPRRDHSIRVPRPDLSVRLGTPNACQRCHDKPDEDAAWAAAHIERWYGPNRPDDPHPAVAIAGGREQDPAAMEELIRWIKRKDASPLVQATAAALLGGYNHTDAQRALYDALHQKEPLVRAAALRSIAQVNLPPVPGDVAPLLVDPVALVRGEAVRVLSLGASSRLSKRWRTAFDSGLDEAVAGQGATLDTPAAHLNIGGMYANLGRNSEALAHYRTAAERFPELAVPQRYLALLLARENNTAEAIERFHEAIRLEPEVAEDHYQLGLLLAAEPDRLAEACAQLAEAARLAPRQPRFRYNLGLALQHQDRREEAERELLAAYQLAPTEPDFVSALAIFYSQGRRWQRAAQFATRLVELAPTDPGARALAADIQRRAAAPRRAGPAVP